MKTKRNRHLIRHDTEVVELFSTFLLLGFVVIFFGAITYFIVSSPIPSHQPILSITGKMIDNNIILEHRGGEPINLNAIITLEFNHNQVQIRAYDYVDAQTKQDGMWGFGEQVVYPVYRYQNISEIHQIDLTIINKDTESSVMYASVIVEPISDLSIEVTVDQQNPKIGTPIVFTITLRNNGNINVTGVVIRFELPEGLIFSGYTATSGRYDNTTAVWENIGTIQSGQSATLYVTALVEQVIPTGFTQLLILQDGSGSIRKSDWDLAILGYISAIGNKSVFPRSGRVELTFVQFGGSTGIVCAKVNLNPTVITDDNVASVVATINNIIRMNGMTPTACGFLCGSDIVAGSSFFSSNNKHVVLLITDGKASSVCNIDGDYRADPPSGIDGLTSAVQARDYLINEWGMDPLKDEVDVIAVHVTDVSAYTWFKDKIAWPQSGYFAPPFRSDTPKQGFVCNVSNWTQFPVSLKNILVNLLNRIIVESDIIQSSVSDPKIANNFDDIVIVPRLS